MGLKITLCPHFQVMPWTPVVLASAPRQVALLEHTDSIDGPWACVSG